MQALHTTTDHNKIKALDTELGKVMKIADKPCMHKHTVPFSEAILIARKKLKIYQLLVSSKLLGLNFNFHINRIQAELLMPCDVPNSFQEIINHHNRASWDLNKIIKEASATRKLFLQNLRTSYENSGNTEEEKDVRKFIKAEALWEMYSKLKGIRKDKQKSKPRRIVIPADPQADPKTATKWKVLDEQSVIKQTIIDHNIKNIGQAQGTPFSLHPLNAFVAFGANSDVSEYILSGNTQSVNLSHVTNRVIKNLQQIDATQTLSNKLTMQEFIDKFKHWKEATYINSGRHLGHYLSLIKSHGLKDDHPDNKKIEVFQTEILTVHLTIVNYCLTNGYTLQQWRISITMMIEKDPGNPKLHRLRVIHIYEADYNLFLGIKHQRIIHHIHDAHLFQDGVYSNRPGFSVQDPVLFEELQHKYFHLTRYPQIKTDVDAASRYDPIVPNFGSLNLRKYGIHPNVCLVQGKMLEAMKYYLQTGFGISLKNYKNSRGTPIYITGQGNAASPIIWVVIRNTLLICHEEVGTGAQYFAP